MQEIVNYVHCFIRYVVLSRFSVALHPQKTGLLGTGGGGGGGGWGGGCTNGHLDFHTAPLSLSKYTFSHCHSLDMKL